jgi:hypothetical protein
MINGIFSFLLKRNLKVQGLFGLKHNSEIVNTTSAIFSCHLQCWFYCEVIYIQVTYNFKLRNKAKAPFLQFSSLTQYQKVIRDKYERTDHGNY